MDNPFQRALCQLLETDGDTLYLSSGYVSRSILIDNNSKRVQFVDIQNRTYSFLESLDKGFQNATNPRVIIVGGMFKKYDPTSKQEIIDPYQQSKFNEFLNVLKSEMKNTSIHFQKAHNDHWHSKIALKVNKGTPVAAIVGSSNLSTFAFGTNSNWTSFNHEADMYIYQKDTGIEDTIWDVSSLEDMRETLASEFISSIRNKNIPISDENEIRSRLYSLQLEDSSNLKERIYKQSLLKTESEFLLHHLFTIKQINRMITFSNQKKVAANSVLTVSPTLSDRKILDDIYFSVQHAIPIFTNLITPNPTGDYF